MASRTLRARQGRTTPTSAGCNADATACAAGMPRDLWLRLRATRRLCPLAVRGARGARSSRSAYGRGLDASEPPLSPSQASDAGLRQPPERPAYASFGLCQAFPPAETRRLAFPPARRLVPQSEVGTERPDASGPSPVQADAIAGHATDRRIDAQRGALGDDKPRPKSQNPYGSGRA